MTILQLLHSLPKGDREEEGTQGVALSNALLRLNGADLPWISNEELLCSVVGSFGASPEAGSVCSHIVRNRPPLKRVQAC